MRWRWRTAITTCVALASLAGACSDEEATDSSLAGTTDVVLAGDGAVASLDTTSGDGQPTNDALAGDAQGDDGVSGLPPCPAQGFGSVTLRYSHGGEKVLVYGDSVTVEGAHLEPNGCLTGLSLTWHREAGCALALEFSPSADGLWQLAGASLAPGDDCGVGGAGEGLVTLSGAPEQTSSSPPPLRCTVLGAPILAHGSVSLLDTAGQVSGVTLELDSLGFEGMLLSKAVYEGTCGSSYVPCLEQECGSDPVLGSPCGVCGRSAICEAGVCVEVEPVIALCQRVLDDRADLSEGAWDGSTATCEAGTMALDWQERALKSTNLYRWLAGQPPLALVTTAGEAMQSCAVMMHAASSLSHNPAESWPCYTEGGATAAGGSNLAPVPAVEAIDLYMADPGNETTIGHRRWILSDWIDSTAFGSTSDSSCMKVVQGFGGPTPWIAWPPPGFYPMEVHNVAYQTIDQTGWTIQTNSVSLTDVTATVTENGSGRPVETVVLGGNYGSKGAIKITPQGWGIVPGAHYTVSATTASDTIEYSFQAVDCSATLNP